MDLFSTDEFLRSGSIVSIDPYRAWVGWGNREWRDGVYGDELHFYFPDFFLKEKKPYFVHENVQNMDIRQLKEMLAAEESVLEPKRVWHNPYGEFYKEQFGAIQKLFFQGFLEKAVPFVFEKSQETLSKKELRRGICQGIEYLMSRPAYLYGFWNEESGMLGATPELLFRLNDKIETVALAGTVLSIPDILTERLLEEHGIVVQAIKEALKPFGTVQVSNLEYLPFAHFYHLMTRIEAVFLNRPKAIELIHALHPTPALGAFPKEAGQKWLISYQDHLDRKRFGAPVGYETKESSAFYVAIRNLQWEADHVAIGAGGGILKGSVIEEEWKEIQAKLKAIKAIFL